MVTEKSGWYLVSSAVTAAPTTDSTHLVLAPLWWLACCKAVCNFLLRTFMSFSTSKNNQKLHSYCSWESWFCNLAARVSSSLVAVLGWTESWLHSASLLLGHTPKPKPAPHSHHATVRTLSEFRVDLYVLLVFMWTSAMVVTLAGTDLTIWGRNPWTAQSSLQWKFLINH